MDQEVLLLISIRKRIRDRRNELELTQEQLSYKCNTDPSYIRKVESGKVNISVKKLNELALALDSSLEELFNSL